MELSVPFAMDPVVYDFELNDNGTFAELRDDADMPKGYHALMVPDWLRSDMRDLSPMVRAELERVGNACRDEEALDLALRLMNRILPTTSNEEQQSGRLEDVLSENGFDPTAHAQLREDILSGRLGLSQNRLPSTTTIEDVTSDDVVDVRSGSPDDVVSLGTKALRNGEAAVVTLAAGVGSRWTQGAGVVKALNPFCKLAGGYRSFLDVHLSKTARTEKDFGKRPPHVVTTGYLTDPPIRAFVDSNHANHSVWVSRGVSIGLSMVPTVLDLQFSKTKTTPTTILPTDDGGICTASLPSWKN